MTTKILVFFLCALLGAFPSLAQERKLHVVFIPKSSDQVFWDLMRVGVDRAVQEDGQVQLTWRGPAHNDDTDAQIRILKAYSKPGVDAILITPTDRARLVAPVRAATEQGIQVVVVDSGLDGRHHRNLVATDNMRGGQQAAQRMATLLGKQGRVLVLRTVAGSASTDERAEGFIKHLREHAPQIQIVADVHGGGSTGKARNTALQLLKKYPDLQGVFAVNESSTDGMLRALRETKLAGKLRFVGFDSTDLLISALEQDEIHGLVLQNPQQMGYLGVKAALAAARGAALKDATIFTDTTLLTRENLQSAETRKLLCVRC